MFYSQVSETSFGSNKSLLLLNIKQEVESERLREAAKPRNLAQLLQSIPTVSGRRVVQQYVAQYSSQNIDYTYGLDLCACNLVLEDMDRLDKMQVGDVLIKPPEVVSIPRLLPAALTLPSPVGGSPTPATPLQVSAPESSPHTDRTPPATPLQVSAPEPSLYTDSSPLGRFSSLDVTEWSGEDITVTEGDSGMRVIDEVFGSDGETTLSYDGDASLSIETADKSSDDSQWDEGRVLLWTSTPDRAKSRQPSNPPPPVSPVWVHPASPPAAIYSPISSSPYSPDPSHHSSILTTPNSPPSLLIDNTPRQGSAGWTVDSINVPATILRQRSFDVMAHPRVVYDVPLAAIHQPYSMLHQPGTTVLWEEIRFQGRKVMAPQFIKTYSQYVGPPAIYGHWTLKEQLGEVYLNESIEVMRRHGCKDLIQECLWGLQTILSRLNPTNYIHSLDVVSHDYEACFPSYQGRTTTCGHNPMEQVTVVIQLNECLNTGPFDLISTLVHEMAHAISPCGHDTPVLQMSHDNIWVNAFALLVREMNRMPHGPIFQELRTIMVKCGDLTWSDIICIYPFTITQY